MKSNLLTISLILIIFSLSAQTQMPNRDFEQWTSTASGTAIPKYWHSFAEGDCKLTGVYSWGCSPMKKNHSNRVSGHSGYGCEIYAKTIAATALVNGVITTGQMRFASTDNNSSENYNFTDRNNTCGNHAAMTFTGRPDSVYFWCKFEMKKPSNVAVAKFHLHDNVDFKDITAHKSSTAQKGKIGNAFCDIKDFNDGKWHKYKQAFTYFDAQNKVISKSAAAKPSYILASFSTNKIQRGGSNGDKLIIDDIEMIYNKRLSYIKINGEELQNFNPDIENYEFYCDNLNKIPVIQAKTQSINATFRIDTRNFESSKTISIIVSHDDGEKSYNIKFNNTLLTKNS